MMCHTENSIIFVEQIPKDRLEIQNFLDSNIVEKLCDFLKIVLQVLLVLPLYG